MARKRVAERGPRFSGVIEMLAGDVKIGVFKNSKKQEGDKQSEYHIVRMEDQDK